MTKRIFLFLGFFCLILTGCQTAVETRPESSALASTGYPSKEVQRISLFYDGSLYLYHATDFDLPKEENWEFLGQVSSVNDLEWPTEDLCGTHLNVGQEVYQDPADPRILYVKYDSGFALFEAEETEKPEAADS